MPPVEAGLEVLRRLAARCHPDRLDASGRPTFNLQLFLLTKDGAHAGVAMWGPKGIAVGDADGVRLEACTAMFERMKEEG
jgi:hypothetical protein